MSELKYIVDAVRKIKEELTNPIVVVAGDFNHTNIEKVVEEFPYLVHLDTGATRGTFVLDMIAKNVDVNEVQMMAPLTTQDGRESDHAVIHIQGEISQLHCFTKKVLKVRPRTKIGEEKFKQLILSESWHGLESGCPSMLAARLEEKTNCWMNQCFPEKNLTIKSTDSPWITYEIKKKKRA